jgi:hypothetical protein
MRLSLVLRQVDGVELLTFSEWSRDQMMVEEILWG